jgi:hypothetical protein
MKRVVGIVATRRRNPVDEIPYPSPNTFSALAFFGIARFIADALLV